MDERHIREIIRGRLASGELPPAHPQRVWAGSGTGETCAACDRVIPIDAVEVEAQGADDKYRHYHGTCYILVVDERFRLPDGDGPDGITQRA